ncbi:hypothetical protein [Nocardia sp. NPDC005978]|uniref:hypothetical protein n=1 Tax=unclassified Nocardia TaxID=2637762 RepID=UPI0033B65F26
MSPYPSPPAPPSPSSPLLPPGLGSGQPTPPSSTTKLRTALAAAVLAFVSLLGILLGIVAIESNDDAAVAAPTSTTTVASLPLPVVVPVPTTEAPAGFPGWNEVYADRALSIPAATTACAQSGVDFDLPAGQPTTTRDTDLTVKIGCGGALTTGAGQALGLSVSGATPEGCRTDALEQPMPKSTALLPVGAEYCAITSKNAVVYFRVTADVPDDTQLRELTATLWTREP